MTYPEFPPEYAKKVDQELGLDSDDVTFDGAPRCTARSTRSGERCKRARTPGTTVCASHGSAAPQVRRKARLRLMELVAPAQAVHARILANPGTDDRTALKAVEMVYDRAGLHAKVAIDVEDSKEILKEKILKLRQQKDAASDADIEAQYAQRLEDSEDELRDLEVDDLDDDYPDYPEPKDDK